MGAYTHHDAPALTADDIAAAVAETGGILVSYGYGFSCPGRGHGTVIDGWRVLLVDTRGMGNHGSFVAVAETAETYAVQLTATLRLLRQWADAAQADGTMTDRGDYGCRVVPLLHSTRHPDRPYIGSDDVWAYFAHSHLNYLRAGDGRHRLWVRPARRVATVSA